MKTVESALTRKQ